MKRAYREAVPDVDTRQLPRYEPGELDLPPGIHGQDEILRRDTYWGEHSHPVHELIWSHRGASVIGVGRRLWTLTPAMGLWLPAGTVHTARARAGTHYRAVYLSPRSSPPMADRPVAVSMSPLLRLLLEHVSSDDLTGGARARAEAVVFDLLRPAERELSLPLPRNSLTAPIAEAILENPADSRSLAVWAATAGVNPRTVTRAFQRETGLTFGRWVAMARAHRAISLLATGAPVEEIARQVGYTSVSAFGTGFRRATGRTPGAFRSY